MFTYFRDFDASTPHAPPSLFDELRRQVDRVWDDFDPWTRHAWEPSALSTSSWPAVDLIDEGATLVLYAEVPGLKEKDLSITLHEGQLALAGSRKTEVPAGYTPHRRERVDRHFSRTFTLPCKVDAEKSVATIKDGILTVTLTKAADAQPKQITVRAH
jgi:HSP20 family protein